MEFIEIGARVHLDTLRVVRTDDGFIAGSADEPYLWFFVIKVDGTTVFTSPAPTAHVAIHESPAEPGNLGPPSEGVAKGESIPIPARIGTWETNLRGDTGGAPPLTKFSTLVVVVAALEHDETRTQDILEIHRRVVAYARTALDGELQQILQEVVAGNIPSGSDIEARLKDQIDEQKIKKIIDDFGPELIGQPVNLVNHDVFVGYAVGPIVMFPELLASSMRGIPIDHELVRGSEFVIGGGGGGGPTLPPKYRVTGMVERTDIKEPPTIGLARLDDGRLHLCGRSWAKHAWMHNRSADGVWADEQEIGTMEFSSGIALAASSDNSHLYIVGRELDLQMRVRVPGGGEHFRQLFDRRFATGAGVACSADGKRVYIMATGSHNDVYATLSVDGGKQWDVEWFPLGIKSITSPALACSADGRKLFVMTIGEDGRLYESIIDVGLGKLAPKVTLAIDNGPFRSAPACACSDDGRKLWFAVLGDDRQIRVSKPKAESGESIWTELSGELVSAPALACSPDGAVIHIAAIDEALRLRHRYSTDAGATWPKHGSREWELIRENPVAWF